jgi:integrase
VYRQAPVRHEEIEPLSPGELLTFLDIAFRHTPTQYPLFLAASHTGMRSGELAGLQWDDIDWKGKFFQLRRSIVNGFVKLK